ncbi:tRNA (adenosine(37)-N6)-threonylcarbamoyltransferase complex dimerization subunit type 1 TsaB [Azotosporobacter soli]|uniref:tRNA (adenosine(37)-N6)-threonylcarbamoyltransferase complex dimerization subunit type 1 TsaB n=1 Tax=Azotosporobacter soli TaxID=3055040 RepID=UPI0031FE5134
MPILALDTATMVSGVALAAQGKVIAELTLQIGKTHSEMLLPHIKELLNMAGIDKKELRAVAVSIGPGSFTGLRIGLATAKALAYALKIPLIGVSTLEALAYGAATPGALIVPLLDAQKGNVYYAAFGWDANGLREERAAGVAAIEDILAQLAQEKRPVMVLGEAAVLHRDKILAMKGEGICLAPGHIVISRASSVALLGEMMLQQGLVSDTMALEPLYIRRSEAEVLWEKRHGTAT